jgi:hypothetical protein
VAARYLGLTIPALHAALHGGRTPAQLAADTPGRSAAGLVAAILTARRARLEAAVAAGLIKRTYAQRLLRALPLRVRAVVYGHVPSGR